MTELKIERASAEDLEELQAIGTKTFEETFAEANTPEDMQKYLAESFSSSKLLRELNDPDSFFYMATIDNDVVGYLKLNQGRSQTELKDTKGIEIERIYVLKAFHGKAVGQKLYDKALEVARQTKADYVWLGVWEKNARAINFYKKNGFVEFDKHIFKLGNDEQTDVMMRLNLVANKELP